MMKVNEVTDWAVVVRAGPPNEGSAPTSLF